MKAPVGLSCRQSGLRSKCRVFSAARTGTHEKGAARPFQTPKGKSKRKKASRFAKTGCGAQRPLRALSGTRVLLTAAPTTTPCIRRRRRSSLLHIFLVSPFYGFADGFTFLLDVASSKGVKSAAKQQIGETRKKCNSDDRRQWRIQGGAVGAAASRMRAAAKQTLGAATRLSAATSFFPFRLLLWNC